MENPEYHPLLNIYRSDYIDSRFYAIMGLYDSKGTIMEAGLHNDAKFFLRSMMKPIQASILADEKIYDYFNFTNEEIAIMQGSHSGSPKHIKLIESILKKIGLTKDFLLCPAIPPLDLTSYKAGAKFNQTHNNCSGKHAMMLSYCVFKGLEISKYTDFSHPVQLKIKEKLIEYAKTNDIIQTVDGCEVPVYGLKLPDIAHAVINYYTDRKNLKLIGAYKKYPEIIGGFDKYGERTDTKIMRLNPYLLSKVGAGGFIYVFNIKTKQILIVKMAQNNNPEREILTFDILYKLKWLDKRYFDHIVYTESHMPIGSYIISGIKIK